MRLLLDAILGILAGVSITFPWLTKAGWESGIVYGFIALVLLGLIFLLHLKPNDNTEKMINAAEVRSLNALSKINGTMK
ncbi:MAG: hypothetical protein ALAOOOJD_02421 [bacterium]|nr:hypothetical protein [bacterium]